MLEPGNLSYIPGRFTDTDGVKRSLYPTTTAFSSIGIRHGDFKIDVLTVGKNDAQDLNTLPFYLAKLETDYSKQVRVSSAALTSRRKSYFYQFENGFALSLGSFDPYELSNKISPLDYRVAANNMKRWIADCLTAYAKYGEMGGSGRSYMIRDLRAAGWDIEFKLTAAYDPMLYPSTEYSFEHNIPVDEPGPSKKYSLAIPLRLFGYFFDSVTLYNPVHSLLPAKPTSFARKFMQSLVGSNWAIAGESSVDYAAQRAAYRGKNAALIGRLQNLGLTVSYPVENATPSEQLDFGVVLVDEVINVVQNLSSLRSVAFKFDGVNDLSVDSVEFTDAEISERITALRLKVNCSAIFSITMLKTIADVMTNPPVELVNYVTANPNATVYGTSWAERFIPLGERVLEDTNFFKKAVESGADVYAEELVAGKTFKQAANVANAYSDKSKLINVIYPSATDFGNSVLTVEVVAQIKWTQSGSTLTGTYLDILYAFDAADDDQRPNLDFVILYGSDFVWTSEREFFLAYFELSSYAGYKIKLEEAASGPLSGADSDFSLYGLYKSPFITVEVARADPDKFKRWFFIASNACSQDLNQLFLQQINLYGLR